jgi:S-sulfo-L-cysteine synthase (3-phospho-L-serine-dependent)
MVDQRVAIVGCGFPQLGLIGAARSLGLRVIGLDANSAAIGATLCHEFVNVSTGDVDGVVEAVRSCRASGITTCGSELALKTTARAAEVLGLPFYGDSTTVRRCQSKDLMRDAYRAGGAPIPSFVAAQSFGEVEKFVADSGLPIIVKPATGWGQRGVSKVENPGEVLPAYERARAAASSGMVLAEEFIDGREFSVNAYTVDGETTVYSVTERIITHYPDPPGITFAEWYPSGLSKAEEDAAIGGAVLGIGALGIRRGPTYTQLRMGPRGPALVETAYRLGGGLDPDVALLASGVSLFRKILGVALDRPDWERCGAEAEAHGGAIGKFIVGRPGRVARIVGLETARSMPGVAAAETYVQAGGLVHPLTDGSKRAGHVLAFGRDRVDAEQRAQRAAQMIEIVTLPE